LPDRPGGAPRRSEILARRALAARALAGVVGAGVLGACGRRAGAGGTVAVLYAGSLTKLMESGLGPAFDRASGYRFAGYAAGSVALANEIRGRLQAADVFVSAAPSVNGSLMGAADGDWVRWYASFAQAPLVIGYNPASRFAKALAAPGAAWYAVMAEPGFRLGRTDPRLDPKGQLTVQLVTAAAQYYHRPDLAQRLLGTAENPAQVFAEQELVGRLQAGQLDAGFFYANEAVEAGIPHLTLPAALQFDAEYTATVLERAPDAAGGVAFVRFLLGAAGQALCKRHGLTVLTPKVAGDAAAVPAGLRGVLGLG
jgi:molybdate/tungstate transport system substrate-binding protein